MLMKICANCGNKLPQGKSCPCRNNRHKLYNKARRDQLKNSFYHSAQWVRLVQFVKARANGLDQYSLAHGVIEAGNTVHHIFTIDERPDLKLSPENLIYLSAKTHNRLHRIYDTDPTAKENLQAELLNIVNGRGV